MGLLDAFTGDSVTNAAKGVAARAASTGQFVDNAWNDSLQGGLGELGRARSDALGDLSSGAGDAQRVINQYSDAARQDLNSNYGTANNYLSGIQGLYQPYATNGTNASNMLANATGLNGSTGNAAATGAFQTSPGYDFQVNQATDAAARKAASLGIAGSGNTLTALSTLGSNLANQEYQQWLGNLSGQVGTGMQATAGQAAGLGAQAQLASNLGSSLAGVDTSQGTQDANSISNLASQQAGVLGNTANSMANLYSAQANGVSNANVGLTGQANTAQMQAGQAQMQASSNALGALFGGAKLLAGGLGGGGGLSSLFGGGFDTGSGAFPSSYSIAPGGWGT